MGLRRKISGFIFHRLMGWTELFTLDYPEKCIICAAPHTSNWDLFVGKLFAWANGIDAGFMMKKDWFFWPLGPIFRHMGGIPVDRSKHCSMVDAMVATARQSETFHLTLTPEGTRKANPKWKKGFYYIARGANLPICLMVLDYGNKRVVAEKIVVPDGDIDRQMKEIKKYYAGFVGRHPDKFAI